MCRGGAGRAKLTQGEARHSRQAGTGAVAVAGGGRQGREGKGRKGQGREGLCGCARGAYPICIWGYWGREEKWAFRWEWSVEEGEGSVAGGRSVVQGRRRGHLHHPWRDGRVAKRKFVGRANEAQSSRDSAPRVPRSQLDQSARSHRDSRLIKLPPSPILVTGLEIALTKQTQPSSSHVASTAAVGASHAGRENGKWTPPELDRGSERIQLRWGRAGARWRQCPCPVKRAIRRTGGLPQPQLLPSRRPPATLPQPPTPCITIHTSDHQERGAQSQLTLSRWQPRGQGRVED